jgi:hypothetical protein
MTDGEVKTNILQAKNQIAQIVICAELNGVSTEKIKDILRKQGVDLRTLKGNSSNYWVKKEKTVDPVPTPDNDKIIKQLFNRVSELTVQREAITSELLTIKAELIKMVSAIDGGNNNGQTDGQ